VVRLGRPCDAAWPQLGAIIFSAKSAALKSEKIRRRTYREIGESKNQGIGDSKYQGIGDSKNLEIEESRNRGGEAMRKFTAVAMGSLVALVGFAGAAHASATVDLIWIDKTDATCTDDGRRDCPRLGAILSAVEVGDDITLAVILTAGRRGSWGAGVSVDYTQMEPFYSVTGFRSLATKLPKAWLPSKIGTTTNQSPFIDNINAAAAPTVGLGIGLPSGESAYLGTVTFHKDLRISGTFEIPVGTDGPGGTDDVLDGSGRTITATTTFNSAYIVNISALDCRVNKKCSVGGSEPQDSCTAYPGQVVTYTYEVIEGCGTVIDDKLGEIGYSDGQTLSRTTLLTETTTNVAHIEGEECFCSGSFSDSVTVTVESPPTPTPAASPTPTPTPTPTAPPVPCSTTWPSDSIVTIGKSNSPTNNQKVSHRITGNIIDPGSVCPDAGACTAQRIPVCAGTGVSIAVTGSTDNTNIGKGVISCGAAGCIVGAVNVTEKYKSVSADGKDTDRMTLLPQ
jgi:hypothetical protein